MYPEYEGTIMYRLGNWRNYAPGCDLAHEEGSTISQACRPAKAVGKLSRAKFGRLFGAQGLILGSWVARRATAQGVGIWEYR